MTILITAQNVWKYCCADDRRSESMRATPSIIHCVVRRAITVMYIAVSLASTSWHVGKPLNTSGSSHHMTMAGTMWQADRSTFSLKMRSSHMAFVWRVSRTVSGTAILMQSQSDSMATRVAKATIMAWVAICSSEPVAPLACNHCSTSVFIVSIEC